MKVGIIPRIKAGFTSKLIRFKQYNQFTNTSIFWPCEEQNPHLDNNCS
jgi:hypothetical protein